MVGCLGLFCFVSTRGCLFCCLFCFNIGAACFVSIGMLGLRVKTE
ncbi:hypothetical protein CsSME_00031631 [Camellia sinensis var. sinensis]